jgi:hypothetical protein
MLRSDTGRPLDPSGVEPVISHGLCPIATLVGDKVKDIDRDDVDWILRPEIDNQRTDD